MDGIEGLDLSILDSLNIPSTEVKTSKKEVIKSAKGNPDADEDNDDEELSPRYSATEVESFEDLLKSQSMGDDIEDDEESTEDIVDETSDEDDEVEVVEDTPTEDTSVVKAYAEWLRERGLADYKDEEFEDSEDFLEAKYLDKVKSGVEEYKSTLPEILKELVDNYEEGVPLIDLIESKSRKMELSSITTETIEEDEKLQETLVKNWMSLQEFTDEEIDEKIEDYKDSGLLFKESKTALSKLQKYEEKYEANLKAQVETQKKLEAKRIEENVKQLESSIMSKEEIIAGMTLSKEAKSKIFSGITKRDAKGFTDIQKKMSDPEMQLKVAQFVLLYNGSLDDVLKQAKTKVAKDTKAKVNTYTEPKSSLSKIDLSVIKKAIKRK